MTGAMAWVAGLLLAVLQSRPDKAKRSSCLDGSSGLSLPKQGRQLVVVGCCCCCLALGGWQLLVCGDGWWAVGGGGLWWVMGGGSVGGGWLVADGWVVESDGW